MLVVGADLKDNRLKTAKEQGADEVVNTSQPAWLEKLGDRPGYWTWGQEVLSLHR